MQNLSLKKFFLYLLIASVAFSALLGIGVILFGNFGEFESKILMTASTVTITSILGLACGAFLETGRGKILPLSGIVLAVISAIVWIILIWNASNQSSVFAKILMTVTLFAAACSLLSLLSIATLDKKFRWALFTAHLAVWSLTAFLFYLIWIAKDFTGEFIPRTIGVLSIVIAALTIITPVFHWLSNQTPKAGEIDAEIARLRARIEELEKQREEIPNNEN